MSGRAHAEMERGWCRRRAVGGTNRLTVDGPSRSSAGESRPAWRRDTIEQSAQPMTCPDCHALNDVHLDAQARWHIDESRTELGVRSLGVTHTVR